LPPGDGEVEGLDVVQGNAHGAATAHGGHRHDLDFALIAEGVERGNAQPEIRGCLMPTQQSRNDKARGSGLVVCLAGAVHVKTSCLVFSVAALWRRAHRTPFCPTVASDYFNYYSADEPDARRFFFLDVAFGARAHLVNVIKPATLGSPALSTSRRETICQRGKEVGDRNTQANCQAANYIQTRPPKATLDLAHVSPMKARPFGERLLREV
jgi:hypothetical protein